MLQTITSFRVVPLLSFSLRAVVFFLDGLTPSLDLDELDRHWPFQDFRPESIPVRGQIRIFMPTTII